MKSSYDRSYLKELVESGDQRLSFVCEGGKSVAWDRFERIYVDNLETLYVKCKYCDCVQKHTSTSGTKGLLKHRCKTSDASPPPKTKTTSIARMKLTNRTDIKDNTFDQKVFVDQLTEENNTLKEIVEKCLKMIDKCFCVNRFSCEQRKEVNVLINNYNHIVFNGQHIESNEEFCDQRVTDRELISRCDIEMSERLNKNQMKIRDNKRVTKAIKKKYINVGSRVCDWPGCDRKFRTTEALNDHKNGIHLELRNFVCDWPGCEEAFTKSCQLKAHTIKCHSSDKPFKCDQCSYETTYKALLIRHKRIHLDVKVLQCDWPGCEFRTNYEQGLKSHRLRHSDERPFKCSWDNCDWSFRQRHHLKAHILKHTGERPYQCVYHTCDRRFASRQAMRFHMTKVHNNCLN